jgi:GNAT superfamily N-acetyltransferase
VTPSGATTDEVVIRDATPADADFVCAKLAETFTNATAAQRRVHFDVPWPPPPGGRDYGVVAQIGERIVGFGGLFASHRVIGGRTVRVLNYSSWWIDPEYRGAGIGRKLIDGIFRPRESSIITLLTLPETMREFWQNQPVRTFERARRVYPFPVLRASVRRDTVRVLPRGEYPAALGEEAIRVLGDHEGLRCQVSVVEYRGAYCAFITRRRTVSVPADEWPRLPAALGRLIAPRRSVGPLQLQLSRVADVLAGVLPCAEIFFVSHPDVFREGFGSIGALLARRQRAVALVGDADRLGLPHSWGRAVPPDYASWRPCPVPDVHVDGLYSEFFVLPVGQESR